MGTTTQLLKRWSQGDRSAADELMTRVYDELRRVAANYLRDERHQLTLEPTALVHEAYIRLVDSDTVTAENRAQFFGMAARLMRNILVDRARERAALKRGGDQYKLSLSQVDRLVGEQNVDLDLLSLDHVLNELALLNPRHSQIVELRYFSGLTIEETAAVMKISHATIEREWRFARAWLARQLSR